MIRQGQRSFLLVVLFAAACGDNPTGSGVDQPIDGTWTLSGVYSEFDLLVQCRLSGEVRFQAVGGGVNTVTGSGDWMLDCLLNDGSRESISGSAAVTLGRLTGEDLSFDITECGFSGTYRSSSPSRIEGHSACNIAFTQTGFVAPIGSWQADRVQ